MSDHTKASNKKLWDSWMSHKQSRISMCYIDEYQFFGNDNESRDFVIDYCTKQNEWMDKMTIQQVANLKYWP